MSDKVALITGITGQDGAYLAEFLLNKGYIVHGIKRRSSSFNTGRVDHLYKDPHLGDVPFQMHFGDMTDATNLIRLVQTIQPTEIYNLAAQSHVQVSFETAEYTANADALGALRLLEAMRILGLEKSTRFYQASTSELYGDVTESPQSETTAFKPRSPYAAAKIYAYWITVNYRQAYDMHASNGILFNHESPLRGETFVTRKITRAVAAMELGLEDKLYLGNLNAKRDWGDARDYVEGMWMILQQGHAEDYVLATGKTHSVRQFVDLAFSEIGRPIRWEGSGVEEKGLDAQTGQVLIEIDSAYFRPTEVAGLLGDASKAQRAPGWHPRTGFADLVREMVQADVKLIGESKDRPGADWFAYPAATRAAREADRRVTIRAVSKDIIIKPAPAAKTRSGRPISIAQPKATGAIAPPMPAPVKTKPKARPDEPSGVARRTIKSRDG